MGEPADDFDELPEELVRAFEGEDRWVRLLLDTHAAL